jgi:hypothetical protein
MKLVLLRLLLGLCAIFFFTLTSPLEANAGTPVKKAVVRGVAQELPGYCMAIRGNGELEPAHWGAMAKTVELLGLPKAMAGGSSAAISMFFLDSMASNPQVLRQSHEAQKERASLLLKSLHGFFDQIQNTPAWNEISKVFGHYNDLKSMNILEKIRKFTDAGMYRDAINTLNLAAQSGYFETSAVSRLTSALKSANKNKALFFIGQIKESLRVFGKFNAESDSNLFFRAGIVSFEGAARGFGKVSGFYAASGDSPATLTLWEQFFQTCGPKSLGLNWQEIVEKNPACGPLFRSLYEAHFKNDTSKAETKAIGRNIPVYPTTAVLTGSAAADFRAARENYLKKMDPHFGDSFHIKNPEEVRFAYWGDPQTLKAIAARLDPTDEKSRRFLGLGMASWQQVLSLSPAEPGLAPLKEFTSGDGKALVSAGGWSDLHPVAILKAAGCEDVVYLTRKGGESIFAQGVAKRLLNLDRDWKWLKPHEPSVDKLNLQGDPSDLTSNWSLMYNLANPKSSIHRSLSQASAILCTNWNDFDVFKSVGPITKQTDVFKNFWPLIEDAYRSSYWINPGIHSSTITPLRPVLEEKRPGCSI